MNRVWVESVKIIQLLLKSCWMINESPGQLVSIGQLLGQSFYTKGLRSIVASINHVDAQVFGQSECPMRALTCDERIHPLAGSNGKFGPSPSCHHTYFLAELRPTGQQRWFGS